MHLFRALVPPLLAAALAGCSERAAPPPPDDPPGTVLRVDGRPVTAAEVDAVADLFARLSPEYARPQLRRLALTNVLLPRAAAHHLAGEEAVAAARAAAERLRAAWAAGALVGPEPPEEQGTWDTLGIGQWLVLTGLDEGALAPVAEEPGRFVVARLAARDRAPRAMRELFVVRRREFPYYEDRGAIDAALHEPTLEILDPDWEAIVPASWSLRMRPEEP